MMMRIGIAVAALALVALPATQASAQYNNTVGGAIIGGTAGAIIGGAATGKAGGAIVGGVIGAAAGAAIGAEMQPRGRYYWYRGDCWRRYRDGSYHRVARRYC